METLEDALLPFEVEKHQEDYTFQQNNASCQKSNAAKQWYQEKDVEVMPRPAKSSALNHSENLWRILSRRVSTKGREFDTIEDLKAWMKPERLKLTLETRGD